MVKEFEVRWEGELPATPQEVWDAFTVHTAGWYWEIEYEPRVGGAERGVTTGGGTVTVWDPPRHFTTRTRPEHERDGFNQLDYLLEPREAGTHLRFTHSGVFAEEYDQQLDACRQHTAFYYHSLGEYLRHFSGRDAVYVATEASARGGLAAMRRALGVAEDVAVGDRVVLTPGCLDPIKGVVDYATHAFLGVRSADALYRFYGRDLWGWPVGAAHHLFADDANEAASKRAWRAWLDGLFTTEAVA